MLGLAGGGCERVGLRALCSWRGVIWLWVLLKPPLRKALAGVACGTLSVGLVPPNIFTADSPACRAILLKRGGGRSGSGGDSARSSSARNEPHAACEASGSGSGSGSGARR